MEEPNKAIEGVVDELVWVCRRNGSWWPGRIIDRNVFTEGSIPCNRPGVPVKLLGRDDGSVDWYNLERSKRIKAFRCGEFDDCIEKVKESSESHRLKAKPVKYARREDAILEALELERIQLGIDISVNPDIQDGPDQTDSDDSESTLELSHSGVSFEEQNQIKAFRNESEGSESARTDSDDDGSERVKRMKGIEDLGIGVKRKGAKMERKRFFKEANGHIYLKRKNRSSPLTKVLERTAITGSSHLEALESQDDSKKKNAAVINTSDSTVSMHISDNSRKSRKKDFELETPDDESLPALFDVPIDAEKKNSTGTTTQSSQSSHVETISLRKEEPNDSSSTSTGTANNNTINDTIKNGTTDWKLKGKRNSRSRKIGNDKPEARILKSKLAAEIGRLDKFPNWSSNRRESAHAELSNRELTTSQKLLPYRQSRFKVNPRYDSPDFALRHPVTGSGLYEINIEVKTGQRPQQVPYISLMSKLNGRPIIGHPVEIEPLEDGYCDNLNNFQECKDRSSIKAGQKLCARPPTKEAPLGACKSLKKKQSPTPKTEGPLSKKMRKLSSFTRLNVRNEDKKRSLVKKVKNPVIACVSLNVVFSRISADLGI